MEDVSPIGAPVRHAVTIPNAPALQDHRFLGQAVLPAVFALEHLAGVVRRVFPDVPLTGLTNSWNCRPWIRCRWRRWPN